MKKAVCLMCLLAVFCTGAGAVGVWVDGEPVVFPDAQPFTDENGRTLVPVRPVAEKLGLTVEWDEANQWMQPRRRERSTQKKLNCLMQLKSCFRDRCAPASGVVFLRAAGICAYAARTQIPLT